MTVLRFSVIFLVLVSTSLQSICPIGWYRFADYCYKVSAGRLTWYVASITCGEMRGTLAVPRSEMEQSFIWETYLNIYNGQPPTSLWIGCNDIEEEGKWQGCHLKDEVVGYENWRDGKPETSEESNCVVMDDAYNGKWADRVCSGKRIAVCQQAAYSNPTHAYCLHTGPDGRVSSQCLVGHVVEEVPADGVVSCGKACRLEPRCRSFNLLDQGDRDEKMTCQLSNVTSDAANEGDLREVENCYMFDI